MQVFLMISFFLLGSIFGNTLALDRLPGWASDLFIGFLTLVAAYLGAHYAYLLNENKESERRIATEVSAGNQAIFNLVKAYNKFLATQKQFIAPYRESKYRAFEIMPTVGNLGGFEPQSTKDIAFLLNSENPNILNEIAQLESEILITLELIAERSKIHRNEVQVKLEESGINEDQSISDLDLKRILGDRLFATMVLATDQMIESVDSVIKGCEDIALQLHEQLKKSYPAHTIIKLQLS